MTTLLPNQTPRTAHYYSKERGANPITKARATLRARIVGPRLTFNGITHGPLLTPIILKPGPHPLKARAVEMVVFPTASTPRHYGATFIRSTAIPPTGASKIPTAVEDHLPLMTAHGVTPVIGSGILPPIATPLPFV
jgi:hypothetical protein